MVQEKKKYGFNWRAFVFQLEAPMIQGCKYPPKASFTPTGPDAKNPGIYFNGNYNHESMEKAFSQALTYDDFGYFLNVVKAVANAPGEEQIVKQIAFKYFKAGEFHAGGVSVGIVRDKQGKIYFAFKNKKIPTVPFSLMPKGQMESLNQDGEPDDIRFVSKEFANTWVDRNRTMLAWAIENAIELDGAGSGYSATPATPATPETPAPMDFDDDMPF